MQNRIYLYFSGISGNLILLDFSEREQGRKQGELQPCPESAVGGSGQREAARHSPLV